MVTTVLQCVKREAPRIQAHLLDEYSSADRARAAAEAVVAAIQEDPLGADLLLALLRMAVSSYRWVMLYSTWYADMVLCCTVYLDPPTSCHLARTPGSLFRSFGGRKENWIATFYAYILRAVYTACSYTSVPVKIVLSGERYTYIEAYQVPGIKYMLG